MNASSPSALQRCVMIGAPPITRSQLPRYAASVTVAICDGSALRSVEHFQQPRQCDFRRLGVLAAALGTSGTEAQRPLTCWGKRGEVDVRTLQAAAPRPVLTAFFAAAHAVTATWCISQCPVRREIESRLAEP